MMLIFSLSFFLSGSIFAESVVDSTGVWDSADFYFNCAETEIRKKLKDVELASTAGKTITIEDFAARSIVAHDGDVYILTSRPPIGERFEVRFDLKDPNINSSEKHLYVFAMIDVEKIDGGRKVKCSLKDPSQYYNQTQLLFVKGVDDDGKMKNGILTSISGTAGDVPKMSVHPKF